MESPGGNSLRRPKSATLHNSFSPTITFLAARSYRWRGESKENRINQSHFHPTLPLYTHIMSTDPVDKSLLSKIVHPHGYVNHVLHQLLHRSTVGLGQRDKTWLAFIDGCHTGLLTVRNFFRSPCGRYSNTIQGAGTPGCPAVKVYNTPHSHPVWMWGAGDEATRVISLVADWPLLTRPYNRMMFGCIISAIMLISCMKSCVSFSDVYCWMVFTATSISFTSRFKFALYTLPNWPGSNSGKDNIVCVCFPTH